MDLRQERHIELESGVALALKSLIHHNAWVRLIPENKGLSALAARCFGAMEMPLFRLPCVQSMAPPRVVRSRSS